MSDSIPLMLSTNFSYDSHSYSANFVPRGGVFGNTYGSSYSFGGETPLFGAWILDRNAPNNPVVFKKSWTDPTLVPSGLSDYLNDAYVMLFSFGGWISKAPAGDLYQTLMQNGGGGALRRLQSISTALSCGVSGLWAYSLISVPGTGTPGIESSEAARSTQSFATLNLPADAEVFAVVTGPFTLTAELVQGADGKYIPVRLD